MTAEEEAQEQIRLFEFATANNISRVEAVRKITDQDLLERIVLGLHEHNISYLDDGTERGLASGEFGTVQSIAIEAAKSVINEDVLVKFIETNQREHAAKVVLPRLSQVTVKSLLMKHASDKLGAEIVLYVEDQEFLLGLVMSSAHERPEADVNSHAMIDYDTLTRTLRKTMSSKRLSRTKLACIKCSHPNEHVRNHAANCIGLWDSENSDE